MDSSVIITKPDVQELEFKVKMMYRNVAENPNGQYHFELGRELAEKLGYDSKYLDQIPPESIESFAGVGYFMDLAGIKEGDKILDLGSGSGMDTFIAALYTGKSGSVTGIDMTTEQLNKAKLLAESHGFRNVTFVKGYINELSFESNTFDIIISNGVINLSTDKAKVFAEASRVLKSGGKLAIADIVTEKQLSEKITCDAALWASCIGGAEQQDNYYSGITRAGLEIKQIRHNSSYEFLSKSAKNASLQYGVKSISLYAEKK